MARWQAAENPDAARRGGNPRGGESGGKRNGLVAAGEIRVAAVNQAGGGWLSGSGKSTSPLSLMSALLLLPPAPLVTAPSSAHAAGRRAAPLLLPWC